MESLLLSPSSLYQFVLQQYTGTNALEQESGQDKVAKLLIDVFVLCMANMLYTMKKTEDM